MGRGEPLQERGKGLAGGQVGGKDVAPRPQLSLLLSGCRYSLPTWVLSIPRSSELVPISSLSWIALFPWIWEGKANQILLAQSLAGTFSDVVHRGGGSHHSGANAGPGWLPGHRAGGRDPRTKGYEKNRKKEEGRYVRSKLV